MRCKSLRGVNRTRSHGILPPASTYRAADNTASLVRKSDFRNAAAFALAIEFEGSTCWCDRRRRPDRAPCYIPPHLPFVVAVPFGRSPTKAQRGNWHAGDGYLAPNLEQGQNMLPVKAIDLMAEGQAFSTRNPKNQRVTLATPKLNTGGESPCLTSTPYTAAQWRKLL